MERRRAAPVWRASLGFVITAIAAVLLIVAGWRALWLNNAAGNSVSQLSRERAAVAYEGALFEFLGSLERFRLQMQIHHAAPPGDARRALDSDIRAAANFTGTHGESFDVGNDWNVVEAHWQRARAIHRPYAGKDLNRLTKAVDDLIYKVEGTSGIQYETNRHAQDLGDMLFAKMPEAVHDAMYADLLAENAQTAGTMSIADRVRLSNLLILLRGDLDLGSDDWQSIAANFPHTAYRRDGAAFVKSATALVHALNGDVLMRQYPAGNALVTRQMAYDTAAAATRLNADVATLLDRQLAIRTAFEAERNRDIYGMVLLAAVLLVGLMLIAAELTARRDREALGKVQQESDRLSAELAREKAERALRLSEAQFRAVFDGAALGIAILDRSGRIVDANAVFRTVYGDCAEPVLEASREQFAGLMRGERDLFEFEQHVVTPGGQEAWTDCTVSAVNDDAGNPRFAICMFRDLTELKRSERRMLHDMTHDALTGLPNRALFETNVREEFARTKSSGQSSFALLVVDLDRFKDINESLGHEAGDFVISQVGHRITAAVDAEHVVSRLGSDEFAVLLRALPDVRRVEPIARRVLAALAKPVVVGNRSIFVSASVGIAIASPSYARGEDVMRDADIAMRYAKGLGGRFAVFDSNMHARAEKRLQLSTDLRLALENGEFDVLYQPIVGIADGALSGAEALIRWKHPLEGTMLPGEFMPLAEQTGLAIPIGRFVLRTVCRQIARWKRAAQGSLFPINVNVSAAELLEPDFEAVVVAATREFDIDPHDVTLEITESVVLDAGARPNALVERLRAHGFQICIDDFGTGYSSLRYLQQFKVDAIKIDRSFVCGPDGDVASEPIVRTLMTLAEAFEVRVVAEGIETQRQRDALRHAGCRYGQGYYYARALSAEEIQAMYPAPFGLTPKHASA